MDNQLYDRLAEIWWRPGSALGGLDTLNLGRFAYLDPALDAEGGESEIFRIADLSDREFGRVVLIVKAAELLDFVDTPRQLVVLSAIGRQLIQATPDDQAKIWRRQLLQLRLFRIVHDAAMTRADRTIDRDFVLETIVTRMPSENYELVFNTFVRWARFGGLFQYDPETHQLRLIE